MKSPIPTWSESKFKNWIISLLRRGTMRWPPRNQCLANAKTKRKRNKKTNRLAQHYRCNECKKDFPLTGMIVDHIEPVIDVNEGFIDFDVYIERMYCPLDNFQALCKPCHKKKCNEERKKRKKV